LSYGGAFGALTEMEPTDAEKLKGQRAQRLLYVLMVVMVIVPILILFSRSR